MKVTVRFHDSDTTMEMTAQKAAELAEDLASCLRDGALESEAGRVYCHVRTITLEYYMQQVMLESMPWRVERALARASRGTP